MAFAALATVASSIWGNSQSQKANKKAAQWQAYYNAIAQQKREEGLEQQKTVLSEAEQKQVDALNAGKDEAAGYYNQGADQAVESYESGNKKSNEELQRQIIANAGGMARLREAIANEGRLSESQRAQISEADRAAANSVRGSSIGGSGRTAAALLKKVHADSRLSALDQNQQMAMAAAGMMAQNENQARGRTAANEYNTGKNVGDTRERQGSNLGKNASDAASRVSSVYGDTASQTSQAIGAAYGANANTDESTGKSQANAATANGKSSAETAGSIGAAVADAFKKYSNSGSNWTANA